MSAPGSLPPSGPTPPSTPPPGPGPAAPFPEKTPVTAYIRPAIGVIVLLYIILFVFLNRDKVTINFLFATASVPLIFVLVGMAILGAIIGWAVNFGVKRREAKKSAARAAAPPKK